MISTVRRPIGLAAAAVVFAAAAASTLPGNGAAGADGGPLLRAVVSVASTAGPVVVDGVRVLATFPRVGAELVAATPAALGRLASDPRVLGISPDSVMRTAGSHWDSADGVLAPSTIGEPAGEPGAGRNATVALLDTGVSDTAALDRASGRLVDGVDVSYLDYLTEHGLSDGDTVPTCNRRYVDRFGHGTFLASLIAGGKVKGSGGRGIGVAPGARIVNVKVADCQGATRLSEVLAGMDWVASHAHWIQVVNIALSVQRPGGPTSAYGADPLTVGVEHLRDAGVLVVAAAGNEAGQVGDPGMDYQALTVGAADVTGDAPTVASFSGSGVVAGVRKPDLVAAGVHVLGVMPANTTISDEHPLGRQSNGLFRGSGTSEATAITSGVAALFLSRHHHASPRDVKASLRAAATPLDDSAAGAGLVQVAHRAVDAPADGQPVSDPASDPSNEASFDASSWSASSWSASSWSASSWSDWLASSWSASSWSASSWSASSWSASSWSASSWSASSWSASSWSASSWSASSWSASSWSASSWSASSWSASSWSASSWSASSWSAFGWGEQA